MVSRTQPDISYKLLPLGSFMQQDSHILILSDHTCSPTGRYLSNISYLCCLTHILNFCLKAMKYQLLSFTARGSKAFSFPFSHALILLSQRALTLWYLLKQ